MQFVIGCPVLPASFLSDPHHRLRLVQQRSPCICASPRASSYTSREAPAPRHTHSTAIIHKFRLASPSHLASPASANHTSHHVCADVDQVQPSSLSRAAPIARLPACLPAPSLPLCKPVAQSSSSLSPFSRLLVTVVIPLVSPSRYTPTHSAHHLAADLIHQLARICTPLASSNCTHLLGCLAHHAIETCWPAIWTCACTARRATPPLVWHRHVCRRRSHLRSRAHQPQQMRLARAWPGGCVTADVVGQRRSGGRGAAAPTVPHWRAPSQDAPCNPSLARRNAAVRRLLSLA